MGAFQGTISYSLYRAQGDLPADFRDRFLERIRKNRFLELEPEAEEDLRVGWVVAGQMLSVDFSPENLFRDSYLCLSLRSDRWSLPAALVKAHIARREAEICQERGRARLSRAEREKVRDDVLRELREHALPAATLVDMVWNLDTGHVRFWSQSGRACEFFEELFEDTFGLALIGTSAWVEALECGLDEDAIGRLADVDQAEFTTLSMEA